MGKKSYWGSANIAIAEVLLGKIKQALKDERFVEAAILQVTFTEASLRVAITSLVGRGRNYEKYWDHDCQFSRLIDYFELAGGDEKLVIELRKYNIGRNKFVHHILKFTNGEELEAEAMKHYIYGDKLTNQLFESSGMSKFVRDREKRTA